MTVSSSQISVKTELSDVNLSMTTDTSPTVSPVATGTKTQPTQQTVNTPQPDQTKVPIASMLYSSMYPVAGSYPPAYFPVGKKLLQHHHMGHFLELPEGKQISNATSVMLHDLILVSH